MVIGELIQTVRREKGLSQMDLGTLIGITQAQISKIEAGRVKPQKTTIKAFCELYGIPKTWIDLVVTEHHFDVLTVSGASHKRRHKAIIKLIIDAI
jgi:transcriptional regulator with XRE-family HTH domain